MASSLPSIRGRGGWRMIKAEGLYSFGDSAPLSYWPGRIRRGSARGSADNAEHSHHQAEDRTVDSSHLYRRKLSPFHLSAEDHTEDFLHSSPKIFYIRSADFLHSKRRFFTFINAEGLDIPSLPCQQSIEVYKYYQSILLSLAEGRPERTYVKSCYGFT